MISASIKKQLRQKVYRRDGWACALCSNPQGIQAHHMIPRSKGGKDTEMNLITLCTYCHFAIHGDALDAKNDAERDYWQKWTEQEAIEYLADYYAPNWFPWLDLEELNRDIDEIQREAKKNAGK